MILDGVAGDDQPLGDGPGVEPGDERGDDVPFAMRQRVRAAERSKVSAGVATRSVTAILPALSPSSDAASITTQRPPASGHRDNRAGRRVRHRIASDRLRTVYVHGWRLLDSP